MDNSHRKEVCTHYTLSLPPEQMLTLFSEIALNSLLQLLKRDLWAQLTLIPVLPGLVFISQFNLIILWATRGGVGVLGLLILLLWVRVGVLQYWLKCSAWGHFLQSGYCCLLPWQPRSCDDYHMYKYETHRQSQEYLWRLYDEGLSEVMHHLKRHQPVKQGSCQYTQTSTQNSLSTLVWPWH